LFSCLAFFRRFVRIDASNRPHSAESNSTLIRASRVSVLKRNGLR
jgi:hypothetical protein